MKKDEIKKRSTVATHEISSTDKDLFISFCTKIVATGFVPAEDLRKEYGPEAFTKCIAMIFRTHRMLREVRRRWTNDEDVLGYEWAYRRFSQAEMKKLPPELLAVVELFKKSSVKYTDYAPVRVRCRWTNKVFCAMPFKVAGQFVHLSPARSSGFGDFEVVSVEPS